MKKQKHIIENATKLIARKIVDMEVYGWPPQCGTIYYQPVRPLCSKNERFSNKRTGKRV